MHEPISCEQIQRVLLDLTAEYHALCQEAAKQYYGATQSYASHCFSRFIDQIRWRYGTGYVGLSDNGVGELHSVSGTHMLHVCWHPEEVRWYIVAADGQEDVARTRRILDAALPYWLQATTTNAPEVPPAPSFEAEEEPDGHYPLPAKALSPSLELRERRYSDGSTPLFDLGTVRTTVRAHDILTQYGFEASTFVRRHVTGDWGTLNS